MHFAQATTHTNGNGYAVLAAAARRVRLMLLPRPAVQLRCCGVPRWLSGGELPAPAWPEVGGSPQQQAQQLVLLIFVHADVLACHCVCAGCTAGASGSCLCSLVPTSERVQMCWAGCLVCLCAVLHATSDVIRGQQYHCDRWRTNQFNNGLRRLAVLRGVVHSAACFNGCSKTLPAAVYSRVLRMTASACTGAPCRLAPQMHVFVAVSSFKVLLSALVQGAGTHLSFPANTLLIPLPQGP
jgi:hypothetical protein